MLLMSGLMLADRISSVEKQFKELKDATEQKEMALDETKEAQIKTLEENLKKSTKEAEDLKADLQKMKEQAATGTDVAQASAPVATPPAPTEKSLEELEHKSAQVKDLTARLVALQADKDNLSENQVDPYMTATIEAERDEAQSEAVAAKAELDSVKAELFTLKEDMDARSKAESTARDELEAEISKQSKQIAELEALQGGDPDAEARLEAAEKTIERMVATAEAAVADLKKD